MIENQSTREIQRLVQFLTLGRPSALKSAGSSFGHHDMKISNFPFVTKQNHKVSIREPCFSYSRVDRFESESRVNRKVMCM